jgi:hypothetical protein
MGFAIPSVSIPLIILLYARTSLLVKFSRVKIAGLFKGIFLFLIKKSLKKHEVAKK